MRRMPCLAIGICLGLAVGARAPGQVASGLAGADARAQATSEVAAASVEAGYYAFLAARQECATGLLESYVPHDELPATFLGWLAANQPSFVYDDALAAIAFLARGHPGDVARATDVLDGLIAIQSGDGSLPESVRADTGAILGHAKRTGNQCWVMLAWLAGWEALGEERWLLAAERVADFLLHSTPSLQNPVGHGGFVLEPGSTVVSTEHNLDAWPAFERLADHLPTALGLVMPTEARVAASRARLFCESRHDPPTGLTFTGTDGGGVLSYQAVVPTDVQTWAPLSLGRAKWFAGYEWLLQTPPDGLWTVSSACPEPGWPFPAAAVEGPSYSDADTGEVWFEGLAQAHAAARLAQDGATTALAAGVLARVQAFAPHGDGQGLLAACAELETGFGSSYFDALAVAPTAWAALASRDANPFWMTSLDDGIAAHPSSGLPTVTLDVPPDAVYVCTGSQPCFFTVTGSSTGVFGTGLEIYLLVEPTLPSAGGKVFTQSVPAGVLPDGSWQVNGQLGDSTSPVQAGDRMRLSVIVVSGPPPPVPDTITVDDIPGLVTTSGLLDASVD